MGNGRRRTAFRSTPAVFIREDFPVWIQRSNVTVELGTRRQRIDEIGTCRCVLKRGQRLQLFDKRLKSARSMLL